MANPVYHADDDFSDSSFEDGIDSDEETLYSGNGYSARRSHPTQAAPVEDSSTTAEAASKAREAAAEQRAGSSSAAPPSQMSSPALSAMSIPWSEPDVPNLSINPPDYATATANRPTYGSIPQMAAQNSLSTTQQQSMSDAVPVGVDEESGLLTRRQDHKRKRMCRPGWCGPVSACNVILVAAVIALITLLSQAAGSGRKNTDGGTITPELPALPDDGNKNEPGIAPYFPPSECAYQYYSEPQYIDFPSITNFSFVEFLESNHLLGGVEGTIHIQPSVRPDQEVDVRLGIAYATTSPWYVERSNYIKDQGGLTLEMPVFQQSQGASRGRREQPCLGVFVGVEVRAGVKLDSWAVTTGNLDVVVADGLFDGILGNQGQSHLQITGNSAFSAIRGKGEIAYWSSRRTIIEFISGNIQGKFALRDLLALKTISGHIDATVDPKEADPERVVPAEFSAVSTSGDIDVQFPDAEEVPSREYLTRLETVSSSIRGRYIAGTSTSIHTVSGDITAQLEPYYAEERSVDIHTASRSGKTNLRVLPPFPRNSWPSKPAEHKSTSNSGSIDVVYPQQWEGIVNGASTSGSISIEGEGVEVIEEGGLGPMLKHVTARKGDGKAHLGFKTISGDIKVRVGG